jgi:hypothetical protein
MICPKCTDPLTELRISYMDYANMDMQQRDELLLSCADDEQLGKLKTTYRMYKYSKWYRELQAQNVDNLPITTLLADKTRNKKQRRTTPKADSEN